MASFRPERQLPIAFRPDGTAAPFHPITRAQFFYTLHQRPRRWHVVERKITIQAVQTQGSIDLRMYKNRLQFRTKIKIFAALRKIKRLDPYSVAGQNQPPGGLTP